jgi:hypothetical protein
MGNIYMVAVFAEPFDTKFQMCTMQAIVIVQFVANGVVRLLLLGQTFDERTFE